MTAQPEKLPAFRAYYHGWRIARGMVQIVLEVPVENSDHAYQVLDGMPNPLRPVWVGVARITKPQQDPQAAAQPEPPNKALSQRAAMCCQDVRFQKWLRDLGRIPTASEEAATAYVRRIAGGLRRNLGLPGFEEQTAAWEIIDRRYGEHLEKLRFGVPMMAKDR